MMFPRHERALLSGDPGAFKRRRLNSLCDGNENAAATLLSFKKSGTVDDDDAAAVSSLIHCYSNASHLHSSPPIRAVHAYSHQKEGSDQSLSSTSTCCSSITCNTAPGKQGDFCKNEIIGDCATSRITPHPVPAWKSSKSSPPPSPFWHIAIAQPPNLPMVGIAQGAGSLSQCSMTLPAGRPLSPPPRLPTSHHHKQR